MLAPYPGPISVGSKKYQANLAVKRALVRSGHGGRGMLINRSFGKPAMRNVHRFQHSKHIPIGDVDLRTFKALLPYFDARGRRLLQSQQVQGVRDRIVLAGLYGVRHTNEIHYTMGPSRMYGVRNHVRPPRIPYFEDCSSFATWCYWLAGAPDPNNLGYNGYGYTGTQIYNSHSKHVRSGFEKPGDLVFYGYGFNGAPKHVAIYIGNGKVVTHGSERDPSIRLTHYRSDFREIRSYVP